MSRRGTHCTQCRARIQMPAGVAAPRQGETYRCDRCAFPTPDTRDAGSGQTLSEIRDQFLRERQFPSRTRRGR